jgi:hypothetical protein
VHNQQQTWLTIAMASTLAGNFTLLGSVANLIVAQSAHGRAVRIGFWDYFKVVAPLTLVRIAVGIFLPLTLKFWLQNYFWRPTSREEPIPLIAKFARSPCDPGACGCPFSEIATVPEARPRSVRGLAALSGDQCER